MGSPGDTGTPRPAIHPSLARGADPIVLALVSYSDDNGSIIRGNTYRTSHPSVIAYPDRLITVDSTTAERDHARRALVATARQAE